jgi:hypothetical protein
VQVRNHANHFTPVVLEIDADALADARSGTAPKLTRQVLRNHGDWGSIVEFVPGKIAAGN